MKLLSWIKKIGKKQSSVTRAVTMFLPLGQGAATKCDYVSLAREGYTQNSVVFSCVREISEAAAGVPWHLYRRLPDGKKEKVPQHPLLTLMEKPNPLQGKFEFLETVVAYLYLSGNSYIECVGANTHPLSRRKSVSNLKLSEFAHQTPRELYVLRPDRMKVLPDPVNFVQGYQYSVAGQVVRLPRDRVLHLKLFHPLDDWYGLSPIQVAALAIDKLNAGDKWNASLLQNSAVPSGALVSKERLSDEQFKRLKSEMREQIQGIQNAREPLLLEQDLDWKELSISPKDMDWIEGLKLSALQIAQIYNIPAEIIGLQPATHQNRREARKALYTEVVCPVLNRLRDALNNWLVPQFEKDIFLDYDKDGIEALAEDQESLWRRANTSRFITINEKRRMVGLADIPGGDTFPDMANTQIPKKRGDGKTSALPGPDSHTDKVQTNPEVKE